MIDTVREFNDIVETGFRALSIVTQTCMHIPVYQLLYNQMLFSLDILWNITLKHYIEGINRGNVNLVKIAAIYFKALQKQILSIDPIYWEAQLAQFLSCSKFFDENDANTNEIKSMFGIELLDYTGVDVVVRDTNTNNIIELQNIADSEQVEYYYKIPYDTTVTIAKFIDLNRVENVRHFKYLLIDDELDFDTIPVLD